MSLSEFIDTSKRILTVSRKPDAKEFSLMAKITGLGIVVIALIGYIVYLIFAYTGLGK